VSGLRAAAAARKWCPKHVEQAIRSAIKTHLLHLVGILFPHIIDDVRSKPHQKFCILKFFLKKRAELLAAGTKVQ
jgi:hypothetical protein